jgi:ankyrin repeat protein
MSNIIGNILKYDLSINQLERSLKEGHNPNIVFTEGGRGGITTPLINAIENVKLDKFKLLIEYGADPELDDRNGYFPLLACICMPQLYLNTEFTKILLEAGADPNRRIIDPTFEVNHTPLIELIVIYNQNDSNAWGDSLEKYLIIAELLLKAGANPYLTNINGESALDLLVDNEMKDLILNFIKTYEAKKRLKIFQKLTDEKELDIDTIKHTAESIKYDPDFIRKEYLENIQNKNISEYVNILDDYNGGGLDDIPMEIISEKLKNLDCSSRLSYCQTNRKSRDACNTEPILSEYIKPCRKKSKLNKTKRKVIEVSQRLQKKHNEQRKQEALEQDMKIRKEIQERQEAAERQTMLERQFLDRYYPIRDDIYNDIEFDDDVGQLDQYGGKKKKRTQKKMKGGTSSSDSFHTPLLTPESSPINHREFHDADDGMPDCPICLDSLRYFRNGKYVPLRSLYTTKCDHDFHFDCAKRHLLRDNRCPICRNEIDDFQEDDLEIRYNALIGDNIIDNERQNDEEVFNDLQMRLNVLRGLDNNGN